MWGRDRRTEDGGILDRFVPDPGFKFGDHLVKGVDLFAHKAEAAHMQPESLHGGEEGGGERGGLTLELLEGGKPPAIAAGTVEEPLQLGATQAGKMMRRRKSLPESQGLVGPRGGQKRQGLGKLPTQKTCYRALFAGGLQTALGPLPAQLPKSTPVFRGRRRRSFPGPGRVGMVGGSIVHRASVTADRAGRPLTPPSSACRVAAAPR